MAGSGDGGLDCEGDSDFMPLDEAGRRHAQSFFLSGGEFRLNMFTVYIVSHLCSRLVLTLRFARVKFVWYILYFNPE